MKLTKDIKKFMICGMTLLSLSSIGACGHSVHVSAKHVHVTRVSHNRINSIYRKMMNKVTNDDHISKSLKNRFISILPKLSIKQLNNFNGCQDTLGKRGEAKFNKLFNRVHPNKVARILTKQNKHISKFDKEVAKYEFADVNKMRKRYGLKPYRHSNNLQAIANMRAPQALKAENSPKMQKYNEELDNGNDTDADDLGHGFDSFETSNDDAQKLDIGNRFDTTIGENGAPSQIGVIGIRADNCGDPSFINDNTSPKKIAYNDVRGMTYYDKMAHNGHRDNILSKDAHYLAVATCYNPKLSNNNAQLFTVEEFY